MAEEMTKDKPKNQNNREFIIIFNNCMKKGLLFTFCLLTGIGVQAKSTYIPQYDNRIVVIDNGKVDSVSNYRSMLEYSTDDGLVSCCVLQQIVTPELIDQIKKMKRAEGWASVTAGFGALSAGFSKGQLYSGRINSFNVRNYIESKNIMYSSLALADAANESTKDLMDLMMDVLIKNNSDKEIIVSDTDRGLNWFILPHSEWVVPLQKDEEYSLRVSSINPLSENVRYIQILSTNQMHKFELCLETDSCWYVPNHHIVRRVYHYPKNITGGYMRINKQTMEAEYVSEEDFKVLKKTEKDKP